MQDSDSPRCTGGISPSSIEGDLNGSEYDLPVLIGKTVSEPCVDKCGRKTGTQPVQLARPGSSPQRQQMDPLRRMARRWRTLPPRSGMGTCSSGSISSTASGSNSDPDTRGVSSSGPLSLPVDRRAGAELDGGGCTPWSPWPTLWDWFAGSPRSRTRTRTSYTEYGSTASLGLWFCTRRRRAPTGCSTTTASSSGKRHREVSFRVVTMIVISSAVALCSIGIIVIFQMDRGDRQGDLGCERAVGDQKAVMQELSYGSVAPSHFRLLLHLIHAMVFEHVNDPPKQAVDSVWTSMVTWHRFQTGQGYDSSAISRSTLVLRCYREMVTQWAESSTSSAWVKPAQGNLVQLPDADHAWQVPHADWVYIAWADESFVGVHADYGRLYDVRNSTLELHMVLGEGYDENGTLQPHLSWRSDLDGRNISEPALDTKVYAGTSRPYYQVQARLRDNLTSGDNMASQAAWSWLYTFATDGVVGLSWTRPISFCGNYSCMEGVLSSDITLGYIDRFCTEQWTGLQQLLLGDGFQNVQISETNSTVFILVAESRYPSDLGILVGSAHKEQNLDDPAKTMVMAVNSTQPMIRTTMLALKERYSSWANLTHEKEQLFTFLKSSFLSQQQLETCGEKGTLDEDCVQVGTQLIQLDPYTAWLAVIALPYGAFSGRSALMSTRTDEELDRVQKDASDTHEKWQWIGLALCLLMAVLSLAIGFSIGMLVVRPLRRLGRLMRQLGDMNFKHEGPEFKDLFSGRRSRIDDIRRLQESFCNLSLGVEAFSKFVPDEVVRSFVRGNLKGPGLCVVQREVTIMFADLRDSTTLAEALDQGQLLRVLTRYFSVMTKIIDGFDGVLAEIQGDGLLVFFNAPQDVNRHAEKAVCSALSQQLALRLINKELQGHSSALPKLQVRIGLHTGQVLAGNIGSEKKMKFGCLGDPVEVAGRLENLCKRYDVDIICSETTYSFLPEQTYVCRRLDWVKVRETVPPMSIYEVIGKQDHHHSALSEKDGGIASPSWSHSARTAFTRGTRAWARTACRGATSNRMPGIVGQSAATFATTTPTSAIPRSSTEPQGPHRTSRRALDWSAVDVAKTAAAADWEEVVEDDVELGGMHRIDRSPFGNSQQEQGATTSGEMAAMAAAPWAPLGMARRLFGTSRVRAEITTPRSGPARTPPGPALQCLREERSATQHSLSVLSHTDESSTEPSSSGASNTVLTPACRIEESTSGLQSVDSGLGGLDAIVAVATNSDSNSGEGGQSVQEALAGAKRAARSQHQTRLLRSCSFDRSRHLSPRRCEHAEYYEEALTAFQEARFADCVRLTQSVIEASEEPERAAHVLQDRAREYLGPNGEIVGLSDSDLAAWTGVLDLCNS